MEDVLARIDRAFAPRPRPDHFTDFRHCCECEEHDATLRAHTRESIGLDELGNGGWDPICFVNVEGYLYYFPALARLALGRGERSYLDPFLFHLTPERAAHFTDAERGAVRGLLECLREALADEVAIGQRAAELEQRLRELAPGARA